MIENLLVSDIGGTNSRFAIFSYDSSNKHSYKLVHRESIKTGQVDSITSLLNVFLEKNKNDSLSKLNNIVIAAAGPVTNGEFCDPPNIPWSIDINDVRKIFPSLRVSLINDFLAQAYACLSPVSANAVTIKNGFHVEGTIAVLGPGTGLGKAVLVRPSSDMDYLGIPSEGGHSNYPAETKEEFEFVKFMTKKHKYQYPSFEDVLSGRGLVDIMEFMTSKKCTPEEVSKSLLSGDHPKVSAFYTKSIARACRCFALETYATGGMFLAGGVLSKNLNLIQAPDFIKTFIDSPTQKNFLEKVEIKLLDFDDSGLWGAAWYGLSHITH
jgi:glucokinase